MGALSENITLTCPNDKKIAIIKADFGRDANSMSCDVEFHSSGECESRADTTQKVRDICQYNSTLCDLTASNATFADNCPGVIKQLRVWYQCVEAPSKINNYLLLISKLMFLFS